MMEVKQQDTSVEVEKAQESVATVEHIVNRVSTYIVLSQHCNVTCTKSSVVNCKVINVLTQYRIITCPNLHNECTH